MVQPIFAFHSVLRVAFYSTRSVFAAMPPLFEVKFHKVRGRPVPLEVHVAGLPAAFEGTIRFHLPVDLEIRSAPPPSHGPADPHEDASSDGVEVTGASSAASRGAGSSGAASSGAAATAAAAAAAAAAIDDELQRLLLSAEGASVAAAAAAIDDETPILPTENSQMVAPTVPDGDQPRLKRARWASQVQVFNRSELIRQLQRGGVRA